jgi:hypothetical protein
MFARVGALLAGVVIALAGLALLGGDDDHASAAAMCPPRTFADLTTTTTTVEDDVTTTTTSADTSTTTIGGESTTTTVDDTTTTTQKKAPCVPYVYDMGFPLVTRQSFISGFGDDRDGGRLHKGVDLRGAMLTAVVAVRSGEVAAIHNDAGTEDCCWMAIEHEDGWESWYIHLNNDTYGTDDGQGVGVRIDLEVGDRVEQGEVIGWLGDSGNAEDTNTPHVHFELHQPNGMAIDPYASLVSAASSMSYGEEESGAYADDDGRLYEWVFEALAAEGIYWPCEVGEAASCADDTATRKDLAALATILTGVEDPPRLRGTPGEFVVLGERELLHPNRMGVTAKGLARLAAGIVIFRQGPPHGFRLPLDGEVWTLLLPSRSSSLRVLQDQERVTECQIPLDGTRLVSRGQAALLLLPWIGDWDPVPCPQFAESLELG